jgi:hypothetical protein
MVKERRSVDKTMETPMKEVAAGSSEEEEEEEVPEAESAPESAEASADEGSEESAASEAEESGSVDKDMETELSEVDDDEEEVDDGSSAHDEKDDEEEPAAAESPTESAEASADESTDTEESAAPAREVEKRVSVDKAMETPLKEIAAVENGVKETPKPEPSLRPAGMIAMKKSHCNAPDFNQQGRHVPNMITTSKYTLLSALPKNLYMQFSRLANVYFLIISVLQLLPAGLSPTNKYATAGPFSIILLLNFIRELYEDSKRHKADREVNNRRVDMVTTGGVLKSVRWKDVKVGDIVQVEGQ